jgi:1-phosphofructokinase
VIVTVALNPAVDKVLIVRGFRPGATNRAAIDRVDVGGKGINVALNLRRFGCEVMATGFVGADDRYGIPATLNRSGIETDFVTVPGETRVNLKLIDPLSGAETEINEPGLAVPPQSIEALATRLRTLSRRASVIVFSGSLPPEVPADLYARLIALARAEGVRTVLDTAGAALAHGVSAGPDLAKPNRAEAEELLDASIGDEESLVAAASSILAVGARSVVLSLGADGALSASAAQMCRARPPAVAVRSTVGAGDAMVAALAYGLMKSLSLSDALRLATAASCAVAAWGQSATTEQIETLMPQVSIAATEAPAPARSAR